MYHKELTIGRIVCTLNYVDTVDEVIGANLKALRKSQDKLGQRQLAYYLTELTGKKWDQQLVSRAESGTRPFRVVDLFAIAAIFEVSVTALMVPPDDSLVSFGNMYDDGYGILKYWMAYPRIQRGDRTGYADHMPSPSDNFQEHISVLLELPKAGSVDKENQ